jgi:hypothetical protein
MESRLRRLSMFYYTYDTLYYFLVNEIKKGQALTRA